MHFVAILDAILDAILILNVDRDLVIVLLNYLTPKTWILTFKQLIYVD